MDDQDPNTENLETLLLNWRLAKEDALQNLKAATEHVRAVELAIDRASPPKLATLADRLMQAKADKDFGKETEETANADIRAIEQLIVAKLSEEELERFAHDGTLFFPRVDSYPSVDKSREEEFFSWLAEKNEDGIVKRAIHPQTLKAWWKTAAEKFAEELSENGLLKVHEEIRIGTRKQ